MDSATKTFWDKIGRELEHINRTLEKLLQILEHPLQQYEPPPENKAGATNEANSANRKMPVQLHIRPTPKHQAKADKQWYKTWQGWKSVLEGAGLGFAILYAIVTCWISIINYRQWRDANKGFEDARKHFEYDERSWAKINYACPQEKYLKLSVIPYCNLTISNTGKSVITALHGVATLEIVAKGNAPSFAYASASPQVAPGNIFTQGPIFPGESPIYPVSLRDSNYNGRQFSPKEADDLISGNSYIAIWGYVAYKDSFGSHWYQFCYYRHYIDHLQTGANANACVKFNEVGEGDAPPGFQAMAW